MVPRLLDGPIAVVKAVHETPSFVQWKLPFQTDQRTWFQITDPTRERPQGQKVPPGPVTPPPPAQTPAKPVVHRRLTPPPPIVAYEDVIASCGHHEKFGLFEDRLDKFRKGRRKKVTDRPCKACRERKRLEVEEAIKVRKMEKKQRVEAFKAEQSQQGNPPSHYPERLPDGAKFEVVYDATRTQWTGTLTIGENVFTGSAGGVFKLLNRLDRQYRESLPPGSSQGEPTS